MSLHLIVVSNMAFQPAFVLCSHGAGIKPMPKGAQSIAISLCEPDLASVDEKSMDLKALGVDSSFTLFKREFPGSICEQIVCICFQRRRDFVLAGKHDVVRISG